MAIGAEELDMQYEMFVAVVGALAKLVVAATFVSGYWRFSLSTNGS